MYKLTGEQFLDWMKLTEIRFTVVIGGRWMQDGQAVYFAGRAELHVTKAVLYCMIDQDTLESALLSLDIVVCPPVHLTNAFTEMEPEPITSCFIINYQFNPMIHPYGKIEPPADYPERE